MESFSCRLLHFLSYRISDLFHPKVLIWWFKRKWRPKQPIITRMMNGLKVRIYPEDIIGRDIFIHGVFEPKESRFVANFLKSGMIFFDIGANLGQYTLLGAQCVGLKGKVHSFEPNKRMFKELSFNVGLNGFMERCFLNNLAVADNEGFGKIPIYKPGAEVYCSLGKWRVDKYVTDKFEEVPLITLDYYIKKYGIDKIDLIKMDIEGAELLALQGMQNLLARTDAPVIILEVGEGTLTACGLQGEDLWDYLMTFGYKMYAIEHSGRISPALRGSSLYGNFVAKKN